jgi:hypothetical protein
MEVDVTALPMGEEMVAAADEDMMIDVEVEDNSIINHNNNNSNNKRWAEARLAPGSSGDHLTKRNKRSRGEAEAEAEAVEGEAEGETADGDDGDDDALMREKPGDSNGRPALVWEKQRGFVPHSDDHDNKASVAGETGLTGSDEWCTRRRQPHAAAAVIDLESSDCEWGEGEVRRCSSSALGDVLSDLI